MAWLFFTVFFLQLVPVALVLRLGRRASRARRWIAATFAVMFVQDCALFVLAHQGRNNLWILYLGNPVQTGLVLLAYAAWERGKQWRRALRLAVPLYVLVSAALALGLERTAEFSRYIGPLQGIVIAGVASLAMVRHAQRGDVPPWRTDVFWVSVGLITYYGTSVLLEPISALLVVQQPDLVRLAYSIHAAVSIVAFALVTVGLLCPSPQPNFSGSSPPAASPS